MFRHVIALIILVLLIVPFGYGAWTVYENSWTPAAVAGTANVNPKPSPPGQLSVTAARALRAYGGERVWGSATTIRSTVTVAGLLFQLKGDNVPPRARITVDIRRPHTVIEPVDTAGDKGILDGFSVTIEGPDGRVVEQRADARDHLQNASISTKWDRLNLLYFLGYAFWGYFTLPYQLTRADIVWTELGNGVLQADYGTGLPVHSRIQRFWFDTKTWLLKRNDYTPVAADSNARVANIVFDHMVSDGIPYSSKRRVKLTPTEYGWVLPAPDLITIDVEEWRLQRS